VEKDLYLNSGWVKSAWVHIQRKKEEELTAEERRVSRARSGKADLEEFGF
jgi:hypothetical protein